MAMVNFNFPVEKVFSWCCPKPGLPERKTLQNLKDDWDRLKAARDHTITKIQENRNMRTLPQVTLWLQHVESLGLRVETLITDYTREFADQCFYGCVPKNCKKRFDLWKQISPMDYEVLDLLSQQMEVVTEAPLVPSAQPVPTDSTSPYIHKMLDQIWIHIQDEQVGLIGLYGMGGVGKTTLLKAIHNKLCSNTQLFDLRLWIVVSQTPNLDDIQNYVGKNIGFRGDDWKIKSQDEKARDIFNVLRENKYILLLDDVWARFDLIKVGIPVPDLPNMSKIIFTTRDKQVCGHMKASKRIQVECLTEEEAWNLFKDNVGEEALNDQDDIIAVAKDVMRKCGGLPLALIVLGRAMTCKTTIHEWEHAIDVLKRDVVGQSPTILGEVFTPLKYSFDNLPNDTIRSCLLYCSLYSEDYAISKREMIDHWICEDFWGTGRSNDLRKTRNEGHDIIRTLVNASLLEEYDADKVKMHDVIRDMMIHIGGNKYCVKARAGLTQIPNDVKWEHVKRMSLMDNPIAELDGRPTECPNLKTMFLRRAQLTSIKIDFSKFVPNLKVLDLSYNPDLTSLPDEICALVHLEYLSLRVTNIQEIPVELKKLVKLMYLDLEATQISKIPEGIFSSLKELSVFKWTNRLLSCDFLSEKLVKELEGSAHLQDLTISALSKVDISHLTSSIKLLSCITGLTLAQFNDSNSLNIEFLREMKHLRELYIMYLKKVEKIVVGEEGLEISTMNFQNGFNTSVQRCIIFGCRQLKNLSWLVFFPNIKMLGVYHCPEMQTLVSENEYNLDNELEPFSKLVELQLNDLPKLENIYVTPLLFPLLRCLGVYSGCNSLKKLPLNSSSTCASGEMEIRGHRQWWDELQWEDEATRITFSGRFRSEATEH